MTIPASFANDVATFHGVKPWEDIFEDARFDVVCSWHAICGGWSFVKGPGVGAFAFTYRTGKNFFVFPKTEDASVDLGQVDLCGEGVPVRS